MNIQNEIIPFFTTTLPEIYFENPLAQTVGFLAFSMSLLTFLSGNDEKFLLRMTYSSAFWAAHFLLLFESGVISALSAGLLNLVDIGKNILAIQYPFNKKIAVGVVCFYIGIGLYMYEKTGIFVDILPVLASIASTIILFTLRGIWMRVAFLGALVSWIFYNISIESIGGTSADIILFIAGLYGICKIVSVK